MGDAENDLESRFQTVNRRVADCARRSGRTADEITLVAVSKTHPAECLREALKIGAKDFGENRVQ